MPSGSGWAGESWESATGPWPGTTRWQGQGAQRLGSPRTPVSALAAGKPRASEQASLPLCPLSRPDSRAGGYPVLLASAREAELQPDGGLTLPVQGGIQSPQRAGAQGGDGGQVWDRHTEEAPRGSRPPRDTTSRYQQHAAKNTPHGSAFQHGPLEELEMPLGESTGAGSPLSPPSLGPRTSLAPAQHLPSLGLHPIIRKVGVPASTPQDRPEH